MLFGVFMSAWPHARFRAVVSLGAFVGAMVAVALQWDDAAHWSFDHTLRVDDVRPRRRADRVLGGPAGHAGRLGLAVDAHRAVEYHTLLLIGAGGMSLLAISNSFVTVFVALELLSICLYILVAMDVGLSCSSLEGGLKYLIVGAVGAALLLYGAAMVYGATGSVRVRPDRRRRLTAAATTRCCWAASRWSSPGSASRRTPRRCTCGRRTPTRARRRR